MSFIHRWGAGLLALSVAGCAAPPAPPTPAAAPDACALAVPGGAPRDTIRLALPGLISPTRAPLAESDAEHAVFRVLYETLVRVDCTGRAWPALAQAWAAEEGGRRWTFVLRSDARFWDGEPVTGHDVVAAWVANDTAGALAPWAGPVVQAAQVMSERVVSVTLRRPSRDVPQVFAHPGLAVTKRAPGLRWPIGTGRYWVDESAGDVTAAPAFGDRLPVLRFRSLATGDARDALDQGVEFLVTDDPAVLTYAASRSDLTAVALPWDRSYVLVLPPSEPEPLDIGRLSPDGRAALARDAVRLEARAAAGPYWWEALDGCGPPAGRATSARVPPPGPRRIVYPREDRVSRDLANRLVAIASTRASASGLSRDAFSADLRTGRAAGYVLALPRAALDPCLAAQQLAAGAPWLEPRTITPLVDVRRRVVLRRGVPGLTVDWDGTVRLR